jgi:hypothetical protein
MSCFKLITLFWLALSLTGCAGHPNSEIRAKEEVSLRLLSHADITIPPGGMGADTADQYSRMVESLITDIHRRRNGVPEPSTSAAARTAADSVLPVIIPALAGFIVDGISSSLARSADSYESSFQATAHRDDFWADRTLREQRYLGFELRRHAGESGSDPVFLLRAAFVPSRCGTGFLIRPICLKMTAARARVDRGEATVDVTLETAMDALWVDKKQIAHEVRLATSKHILPPVNLDDSAANPWKVYKEELFTGWFPAVPVSEEYAVDKRIGLGMFRLVVNVMEKDTSEAADRLRSLSDVIKKNRDGIVDTISP